MISRPRDRATLRSYLVSCVLLMMLAALIVSRARTSLAPAGAMQVSFTHSTDGGDDSQPGSGWHAHGGVVTEGDQLSDGLPEWVPGPAAKNPPRLAAANADGEQIPLGRDIEPLKTPPRG